MKYVSFLFWKNRWQKILQKINTLSSIQTFETSSRLSTVDIDLKKILKLIQCLDSNRARGYDDILIRMLKNFGPSIKNDSLEIIK